MKTIACQLIVSLAALCFTRASVATELHIAVSPFLRTEQRQTLIKEIPSLLLDPKRLPAGARVVVWDAWQLVTIADFDIPALQYDSPQARAPKLVKSLASFAQWLRAAPLTDPAVPTGLPALKAPEWLELISRQPASGHRSILLLGSPIYLSPTEPSFSMTDTRYPADAHLRASLTDSVFGLAGKTNRLAYTSVHWCYFTEASWQTELHRTAVTRFWGLFTQLQGGALASFGADLPTILANSTKAGLPPVAAFVLDPTSDKLEMHTAAPRRIPLWLHSLRPSLAPSLPAVPPAPLSAPEPPKPDDLPESTSPSSVPQPVTVSSPDPATSVIPQPVAPAIEPQPASEPAPQPNPIPVEPVSGKLGIGIAWDAEGVDLDLYVRPAPSKRELWYRSMTSSEGRYFHDYRNRNLNMDYEYVELDESVDLQDAQVWINYFKGQTLNPTGKLCVHYRGRSYVTDFCLRATRGNRGVDMYDRQGSRYWVEINLAALVAQRPQL